MSKSLLYAVNTNTQTVAAGGSIDLGTTIRRYGPNVSLSDDTVVVTGGGYYKIDAAFTISATTAGTVAITATKDGTAIPGAVGSASVAVGDVITIPVVGVVREIGCCCDRTSSIAFVLSGAAESVTNSSVIVERS